MSLPDIEAGLHPEGLTPQQEMLANALITTKTFAKVRRRNGEPGSRNFYNIERPIGVVDFAQEGEFAIKEHDCNPEAPLSPLYINLRNLPTAISHQIGLAMAQLPDGVEPEWCVGIPDAGIPLAISYAAITGIDYGLALQKNIGNDGKRAIEPYPHRHPYCTGKVRIVDDVMSQGHSKVEAITALRGMGFEPTDLTILIDREQGGKTYVERELNIPVRSVFTLTQLLEYYLRTGQVTRERYMRVMQYLGR